MKNYLSVLIVNFIVFFIMSCSSTSLVSAGDGHFMPFDSSIIPVATCSLYTQQLTNTNLRTLLKANQGKWIYAYSFHGDSCFVIEDLRTLPCTFSFRESSNKLDSKAHPEYRRIGKEDELFNLLCYTEQYQNPSYPLLAYLSKDSTRLKIVHYSLFGGSYTGDYFIKQIDNKLLTIVNSISLY